MKSLIVRIVLGILAAAFFAVCVIAEVRPYLLVDVRSVPMWSWYTLAGTATAVFVATWIPFKRIGAKLVLKILLHLQRTIQTTTFQKRVLPAVLRPILYPIIRVALIWFLWTAFTNPDKLKFPNPESNETFSQINTMLDQIKASFEQRVSGPPANENERDRGIAVSRAMTWGMAGVAIILLTTVILGTHPTTDRAALVAAACFAYAIPTLIACGFIQVSHTDTSILPPTVREAVNVTFKMHLAQFFVCIGVVAMLWSYDPIVSGIFMVAVYWAYRQINRAMLARVAKPKEGPATLSQPTQTQDKELPSS